MRWPWTDWTEKVTQMRREIDDSFKWGVATQTQIADLQAVVASLESRVAELSRKAPSDDPTGEGLPGVVRAAIDEAVAPWDEDRLAIKARGRMIRGARARLRAGITDAVVAEWVRTGEDQ